MNDKNKHVVPLGTIYDFNKQLILKQGRLSESDLEKIKPQIEEWFNWQIDGYAMLLCRERYDFTVFHLYEKINRNPPEVAARELIEVLKNRGEILSIEKDTTNSYMTNNAWEIWLNIDGEAFAYYLFNCDDWVIQC